MKRVLLDSDVLLDVLMQRQTFFLASAQVLEFVAREQVSGYVSGHAVTNIFYILRRSVGSDVARSLILRLLEKLQVAGVTDEVVRQALSSQMSDFEDAVTSEAGLATGVEAIVTRNTADFRAAAVPVMTPIEFLEACASDGLV